MLINYIKTVDMIGNMFVTVEEKSHISCITEVHISFSQGIIQPYCIRNYRV